ncbi:MAG: alpha/beta hydrolase [Bacteroidetes bacterium]|jgi:pimeloyl-ACP methyl ester carboxylesterase|nr:alpha/beta hydrolase [Bacteroidota bacterium]MDF1863719.1 alpha/beta hydrolase [Saprospiraceae bacterium]
MTNKIKRPSIFWLATEIGRAVTEASLSVPFRTFYSTKEEGDGHPVLVLPGFMASDTSTAPLRGFINKLGYNALSWDLGRNLAKVEFLEVLIEKVENIHQEYGENVSLVGWSLGGVFARQIAKERPNLIRQIITLGSPFRGVQEPNNAAWIYDQLVKRKKIKETAPDLIDEFPKPAPVPTTAIYTKEDGVVPWQLCMEKEETYFHQNVQVRGSHLGLGVNASVLRIIANRLQYNEANWVEFNTNNSVENLILYPSL